MTTAKPVVLIAINAFWPGHEAAGPNLSVKALCETLGDEFEFRILGRDTPFEGGAPVVAHDEWCDLGYARALYLPVRRGRARGLVPRIASIEHDVLMLNSFFDREFTLPVLVARLFRRMSQRPALLSTRGELSREALDLKSFPKRLYRAFIALTGLMRGVDLHVTSGDEERDVRAAFPHATVHRITNFRPLFTLPPAQPRAPGTPLRAAFVGRISPVKGLDVALEALAHVSTPVRFEVFGPISDADHWRRCESIIARLPAHIVVAQRGAIANDAVGAMLAGQDVMIMPSRSENFGHAIFESLCAGTPVVIGDQTPWRGLEARQAGFDVSLGEHGALVAAIARIAALTPDEHALWRRGARREAERFVATSEARAEMSALLRRLTRQAPSANERAIDGEAVAHGLDR